jgi:hypothetical protein
VPGPSHAQEVVEVQIDEPVGADLDRELHQLTESEVEAAPRV